MSVGRRRHRHRAMEISKVRFNLLPENSRVVAVRKHATICAWGICALGCYWELSWRVLVCFVSCCYTTTDDMNKIAFAFTLRWSSSLFLPICSRGQRAFCVSVHFNCRCARSPAVSAKPRRQRLCDGRFCFVIIRCFASRNGKERKKKMENASRARRTSVLLTVQQWAGVMMMVDGVCARAPLPNEYVLWCCSFKNFNRFFSRARHTPPRRSPSFVLFLFVLVAGWRVGAFDSELGLKLAHFKAEVGRACSRFACRCLLLPTVIHKSFRV